MAIMSVVLAAQVPNTRPPNGKELEATLRGEMDITWVILFKTDSYEDGSDAFKTADTLESEVETECRKLQVTVGKDESEEKDITYFEKEIAVDGTTEVDAANLFGPLLKMLGFETGEDADAGGDDAAAEGDEAAAEGDEAADDATRRRNLQGDEAAEGDEAAAEGDEASEEDEVTVEEVSEEDTPVPLVNLQSAPYALIMRNQQGYRVSGKGIAKELCLQAKRYKDLVNQQEKAKAAKAEDKRY